MAHLGQPLARPPRERHLWVRVAHEGTHVAMQLLQLLRTQLLGRVVLGTPASATTRLAQLAILVLQPRDEHCLVHLLVHTHLVLDHRHPLRKLARGDGFVRVAHGRVDRGHHDRLAVAAEGVAQHGGQHRVSVGHVPAARCLALVEGHDHKLELKKTRIDVDRLVQCRAARAALAHALAACEVDEVELGAAHGARAVRTRLERHREHAVRARRDRVHRRLRDGAIGIAHEEEVESRLLAAHHVRREPLEAHGAIRVLGDALHARELRQICMRQVAVSLGLHCGLP